MLALFTPRVPDLPAVLVKEFREELRARTFVHSSIWFHVILIALTLFSLPDSPLGSPSSNEYMNVLFWSVVGFPLLILIPLRAVGALSKEANVHEFELLFLTPLTGTQLVFQKWLALCMQGLLYLSATAPYAVVRYFLCRMNPVGAIEVLGQLLFWMLLGVAGGIVLSAWRIGKSRFALAVFIAILLLMWPMMHLVIAIGYGLFSPGSSFWGSGSRSTNPFLMFSVFGGLGIAYLLEVAAGIVAPPQENHALRKRLIGLAGIGIAAVLVRFHLAHQDFFIAALVLAAPILVGALNEAPQHLLSIYAPLRRFPAPLRFLFRIFYPGWIGGMRYAVAVAALLGAIILVPGILGSTFHELPVDLCLGILGSIFLPVAITNLFLRFRPRRLFWYLMIQLLMCSVAVMAGQSFRDDGRHPIAELIASILPQGALMVPSLRSEFKPALPALLLTLCGTVIALYFQSRKARAVEHRLESAVLATGSPSFDGLTAEPAAAAATAFADTDQTNADEA